LITVPLRPGTDWPRRVSEAVNAVANKRLRRKPVTGAFTATENEDVITCDATGAAFTVTLPKANLFEGYVFYIKKIDASANAVTIDGNGAETIDGAANASLTAQWESRTLMSDGSNWIIL
jgi:hypothetical protein